MVKKTEKGCNLPEKKILSLEKLCRTQNNFTSSKR